MVKTRSQGRLHYLILIAATGLLTACGETGPSPVTPSPVQAAGPDQPWETAGGVSWQQPGRWQSQGPRPLRAATYTVPPSAGDSEAAELAVFFFGAGQGGNVEANIQRWMGQFEAPGGGPVVDSARGLRDVGGLVVTTLEAAGTYKGGGGPMSAGQPQPDYAMLAAIVEGPVAPVFFKLTGPVATVEEARIEFDRLLAGLRLDSSP